MSHPTASPSLSERATSMARRLLSGVGSASFAPYRDDAQRTVAVLTHGLTDDGDLVVAVLDSESPGMPGGVTPMRLDVRREAAEARVRVIAASVHLLGTIEWLAEDERLLAAATRALPEPLETVAELPGVRLGLVRAERVLLHDASGVTPFPYDELVAGAAATPFPTTAEELAVQEVVASVPDAALRGLCDAVAAGRVAGRVLSDRPTRTTCTSTVGRVLVVDVDALGVNLMRVDPDRTSVVFVQLPDPVHDVAGLRAALDGLMQSTGEPAQRGE